MRRLQRRRGGSTDTAPPMAQVRWAQCVPRNDLDGVLDERQDIWQHEGVPVRLLAGPWAAVARSSSLAATPSVRVAAKNRVEVAQRRLYTRSCPSQIRAKRAGLEWELTKGHAVRKALFRSPSLICTGPCVEAQVAGYET